MAKRKEDSYDLLPEPESLGISPPPEESLEELPSRSSYDRSYVQTLVQARLRASHRNKELKVPTDLKGAEAEEYADKKLVELLPFAAAEYEYALRYGSDKQRWEAAKAVMESTGRGKRDLAAVGVQPIIILTDGVVPPWKKKGAVVAGEVLNVLPEGKE